MPVIRGAHLDVSPLRRLAVSATYQSGLLIAESYQDVVHTLLAFAHCISNESRMKRAGLRLNEAGTTRKEIGVHRAAHSTVFYIST